MFLDITWKAMIGLSCLVNCLKLGGLLKLDENTQIIINQQADWFCQFCYENDVEEEQQFWFSKLLIFEEMDIQPTF